MAIREPQSFWPIDITKRTVGRVWFQWLHDLVKAINNTYLADNVGGTTDVVTVADDGDGTITLDIDDDYLPNSIAGTTGEITVTDDGDGTITLSASPEYGEISVKGNSNALTLTTQNTWYQVTNFDTDGVENGANADHTNDHITVNTTGIHKIACAVSLVTVSANQTYELMVKKNNGASDLDNCFAKFASDALTTAYHLSLLPGLVNLTAADTIELWARCTSAGGQAITADSAVLNIERLT